MLKDKRYILYYLSTSIIVALFLGIEDYFDADSPPAIELLLDTLLDVPKLLLLCVVLGIITSAIIKELNKRFPWEEALMKRFLIELLIILSFVLLITILSVIIMKEMGMMEDEWADDGDRDFEVLAMIMSFITLFMLFAFHEIMGINDENSKLTAKAKDLEEENYIARFEMLKQQINPHFLFNSLNVLSSLIYKDTKLSDQFITRFAEVFRYILELNKEPLVALEKELEVMDSYVFLQQIRYGENLVVSKSMDFDISAYQIPPMTLQMVIENSIKHNVISKENPLTIDLAFKADELIVSNSYQVRDTREPSTKMGQNNLKERYQLLGLPAPDFYISQNSYIAKLPLYREKNASTDH